MQVSTVSGTASRDPIPGGFPALLIDRGLISRGDLAVAEPHAAREHVDLAEALITLGLTSEADSYATLAAAAGTDVIGLEDVSPSGLAVQLVPEKLARRHLVVPLEVDNRTLTYATCRPLSAEAGTDIGFASGRQIKLRVATRSAVLKALDRCYPKLGELDVLAKRLVAGVAAMAHPTGRTPESLAIDMCNDIIARAVALGASDVQIECGPAGGTIGFRVGGVFKSLPTLPVGVAQPIVDRFKVMARIGVAVRHRPQDGTLQVSVQGQPTSVRLSARPVSDGEQIMLRIVHNHAPAKAAPPALAMPNGRGRLRVLVTDDEPITRLLIKRLLEREGFAVLEATNGDQAIEIAAREHPDLMIIDLNMPVMDGYEAIHFLRRDFTLTTLPIIVLTAQDGQSVERRVLELGANDYLIKPFEPGVLLARVTAVFQRRTVMAA